MIYCSQFTQTQRNLLSTWTFPAHVHWHHLGSLKRVSAVINRIRPRDHPPIHHHHHARGQVIKPLPAFHLLAFKLQISQAPFLKFPISPCVLTWLSFPTSPRVLTWFLTSPHVLTWLSFLWHQLAFGVGKVQMNFLHLLSAEATHVITVHCLSTQAAGPGLSVSFKGWNGQIFEENTLLEPKVLSDDCKVRKWHF